MPSDMPAKKNASIEVRLPDATKAAFMARCARQGRTASDAIRTFIDAQLAEPPADRPARPRPRGRHWRIATAAVAGTVVGFGVAAPSIARSTPAPRPGFHQLDHNRDGVLDPAEYSAR